MEDMESRLARYDRDNIMIIKPVFKTDLAGKAVRVSIPKGFPNDNEGTTVYDCLVTGVSALEIMVGYVGEFGEFRKLTIPINKVISGDIDIQLLK